MRGIPQLKWIELYKVKFGVQPSVRKQLKSQLRAEVFDDVLLAVRVCRIL